jgi:hypothetical protein
LAENVNRIIVSYGIHLEFLRSLVLTNDIINIYLFRIFRSLEIGTCDRANADVSGKLGAPVRTTTWLRFSQFSNFPYVQRIKRKQLAPVNCKVKEMTGG